MKALAVVIGIVFAVAVAALAAMLVFPARLISYTIPQPSVEGWPQLLLRVEADNGGDVERAVVDSFNVIDRRLKDLGVRRFLAQPQGNDRLLLSLPKTADINRVIEVTTRRGRLQFRLIETNLTPEQAVRGEPPPHADELHSRDQRTYLVNKRAVLTGRDLVDAQAAFDARTNEPVVNFRFSADGARRFAQVTQENVGRPFAIVFDNEVLSAPIIREPILGGTGQISGAFTVEQANDLAIQLRSGELPAKLTLLEQR